MLVVSALISLLAAASTAAAAGHNTYHLRVLRPGSAVHHGLVSASKGGLRIDGPAQKVDCANDKTPKGATFVLNGEAEAYLYTGEGTPTAQQIFTDRSGMGRGIVGYLNDAEPIPEQWQTQGFHFDHDGNLKFEHDGFWACPANDGGYALWLSKFAPKCVRVQVHPEPVAHPVACTYKGGH